MGSSDPVVRPVRIARPVKTVAGKSASASRFDHSRYVSTMEFRCNLKCVHCMIEDTMDRLVPQTVANFKALLEHNATITSVHGPDSTGSEITLHRDLPEWARMARRHGFDHVRIQTHGMRLAQPGYCAELIDAGVAVFAQNPRQRMPPTMTQSRKYRDPSTRPCADWNLLHGHEHVTTITNTVVTSLNFRQLADLVERLKALRRLAQMEFWFYFPMHEQDTKGLIASHLDALPFLKEAIAAVRALDRGVEVKNFPECRAMIAIRFTTISRHLLIDPGVGIQFSRNGFYQCVYREQCGATQCLGLNSAYIKQSATTPMC